MAGLAVTRLPTTVARLRSAGEPTSRQAWASGRAWASVSAEAMTSLWVTSGPSRTTVAVVVDPVEPGDPGEVHEDLDAFAGPAVELDDQVGAAGDRPGARPERRQQAEGLVEGGRCDVPADSHARPLQVVHYPVVPL